MKSRETFLRRLFTLYIPLLLILLFILFPFYWTFITSIKPEAELYGADRKSTRLNSSHILAESDCMGFL